MRNYTVLFGASTGNTAISLYWFISIFFGLFSFFISMDCKEKVDLHLVTDSSLNY